MEPVPSPDLPVGLEPGGVSEGQWAGLGDCLNVRRGEGEALQRSLKNPAGLKVLVSDDPGQRAGALGTQRCSAPALSGSDPSGHVQMAPGLLLERVLG